MNLLIVKLYQSYKRKGDPNPEMKIAGYIALVLYFVTWCIVIPMIEIISFKFYDDNLKSNRAILISASLLTFYVYYRKAYRFLFKDRRMKVLEEKYKAFRFPTLLLYAIVILLPVFLMLLGPTLAVLLTGGEILGNRIIGIIR